MNSLYLFHEAALEISRLILSGAVFMLFTYGGLSLLFDNAILRGMSRGMYLYMNLVLALLLVRMGFWGFGFLAFKIRAQESLLFQGPILPLLDRFWYMELLLLVIWGIGLVRFCGSERANSRTLKKICSFNRVVCEDGLLAELFAACRSADMKKVPLLACNPLREVPGTAGIRNPVIMLPLRPYGKQQLKVSLQHELIHCRRRDYLMRTVHRHLLRLFWFLPFGEKWVENYRNLQEITCDAEICMNETNKISPADYFEAVIGISADGTKQSVPHGAFSELEQRMLAVKSLMNQKNRRLRAAAAALLLVLSAGLVFTARQAGYIQYDGLSEGTVADTSGSENHTEKQGCGGDISDYRVISMGELNRIRLMPGETVIGDLKGGEKEIRAMVVTDRDEYSIGIWSESEMNMICPGSQIWNGEIEVCKDGDKLVLCNDAQTELFCEIYYE